MTPKHKQFSQPKQRLQSNQMPTEQQLEAMCRRVEQDKLNKGAIPAEVALLRQYQGNRVMSALVIGLMVARLEEERRA